MKTNHYKTTNLFSMMISKRYFLVLFLALAGMTAKAQTANNAYIFHNDTYGYVINNNGIPGVNTTFTKSAIWVASGTLENSNNTLRNIRSYTDNSKYMTRSGTSLGFTNTAANNWQRTNAGSLRFRTGGTNYYLKYTGTAFDLNSTQNSGERFTATAITLSNVNAINPSVSITAEAGITGGGIQLTPEIGTYSPACTSATVSGTTYYWTSTTEASTTRPTITDWSDATLTWTVTTGATYASVDGNGLVTITGNPTGNIVVRLGVSKGDYTNTNAATFTLTRAAVGQSTNTESTINSFSISPSSAALYVGQSQAFTASATVNNTTYNTPAHTSLTGSGNTYHYYNGTLYTNTEAFSEQSTTTATPNYAWSKTGEGSSNATLSATSGANTTVTHTPGVSSDKTLTLTVEAAYTRAISQTKTAQVSLYAPFVAPTITRSGNDVILSTNSLGATIYYTTDGSTPSASNGTVYTAPINLEDLTLPVTIKAIAVRGEESTSIAEESFSTLSLEAPVISISSTGAVTITCSTEGASIRYTTDGTTPTSSTGTVYNGTFTVSNLTTVKAIAYKTGYADSEIASEQYITSGVSGNMVILNDLEDHSWSYYSDGNQPIHSLNPADVKITYFGNGTRTVTNATENGVTPTSFSLDATTVAVSGYEPANQFVYYKTLENDNAEGNGSNYSYTLIPNPFSKRPTVGNISTTAGATCWRGFYGWRVKSLSSGLSIQVGTTTYTSQNINAASIIPAESEITFVTTNEYGNEVQFEAMWAQAWFATAVNNNNNLNANVTYERNFIRVAGAINTTNSRPATIMELYPNGTTNGTTVATAAPNTARNLTGYALSADTKFEFIALRGTNVTMTANNHYLCFGRGISTNNTAAAMVQGMPFGTYDNALSYTIRMESGKYTMLTFVKNVYYVNNGGFSTDWNNRCNVNSFIYVNAIMGCDYDRAKNDNEKLDVSEGQSLLFSQNVEINSVNRGRRIFDCVIKSGNYQKNYQTANVPGDNLQSFYCGPNSGSSTTSGSRYVTVEGGKFGIINGGTGGDDTDFDRIVFTLRMKGGSVERSVYGAGANSENFASRKIVVTGGTVKGWIAGGANGTNTTWGASVGTGNSYIYVGGNTVVGGSNPSVLNGTDGGNIFGAGRGNANQAASMLNSNVVVADNADILRNVYGGGNYGYIPGESNVYVLGGTVHEKVFGGAYGNVSGNGYNYDIPVSNVYVRGGVVTEGVYGGSNWSGNVGNVTMHIDGGTVGSGEHGHGVFGGGLGQPTRVTGNVDLTLGETNQTEDGVIVYGDVYGGSALGTVNTNASNHTNVTLNKGIINGSLYGGALGQKAGVNGATTNIVANVNGPVTVVVNGGSVVKPEGSDNPGSVFGCNNLNGSPQNAVSVTVNATDPTIVDGSGNKTYAIHGVYGGGNQAHYVYNNANNPTVTINGCESSIKDVYGGGNAAAVPSTHVTINGGDIDRVFAGGNGESGTPANVGHQNTQEPTTANSYGSGTAEAKIYGGTINQVFGGSNSHGVIRVGSTITVDKSLGSGICDMKIAQVYGGGNEADGKAATINIGCTGTLTPDHSANPNNIGTTLEGIGTVFGGANMADIGTTTNPSNITLNINSGIVNNVFGGNNTSGDIHGTIAVNIIKNNASSCASDWYVGDVFGGGNLAQYTGSPVVNILNGTVSRNVYGGGKGELVDGAQHGEKGKVTGNPQVTIGDSDNSHTAIVLGEVYGGGDAATVVGIPVVEVNDCSTSIGYLYGGGNAADVNGTDITFNAGTVVHDAFGGGHGDRDMVSPQKYADVHGDVNFEIKGGTIDRVFAGSNSKGDISGSIALDIDKDGSCPMKIREVYGGGNEAAGNAGNITIGCTGDLVAGDEGHAAHPENIGVSLEGIGSVYGGANQADIGASGDGNESNITLNINSGMVGNVFGGNNTSGTIYGSIEVNIKQTSEACGWYVGDVFGGGNVAAYSDTPSVNIINGTVSGSVYGGGNEAGVGGGHVVMTGGTVLSGLYGGCNTSGEVSGDIYVSVEGGTVGSPTQLENGIVANIFGGGYGSETSTTGNVEVNFGGLSDTHNESLKLYGDIYGGSALGDVNTDGSNTTTVNILNGTLYSVTDNSSGFPVYIGGNVYGGGLGDASHAAAVNGDVVVNIGAGTPNTSDPFGELPTGLGGNAAIGGNVYGCNNTSGSPQQDVTVNVFQTYHTEDNSVDGTEFAIANVFGGGNQANYTANGTMKVNVYTCDNTIGRVFGGGDAAATKGVETNIQGGRFSQVFGGGNGETGAPGANVDGDVNLNIHGGNVGEFYGGSNEHGSIDGRINILADGDGPCGGLTIGDFFCGGNFVDITNDLITTIGCSDGESITLTNLYGGCNQANIGSQANPANVVLNIYGGNYTNVFCGSRGTFDTSANIYGNDTLNLYGGTIENAFGGCNINGNVFGSIVVNVIDVEGNCPLYITNIYGGSNLASYKPTDHNLKSPVVNVAHAKYGIRGNVYGGGKGLPGTEAEVVANPRVNIGYNPDMDDYIPQSYLREHSDYLDIHNVDPTRPSAIVAGSVFGGGDAAKVIGSTIIYLRNRSKVFGNVYGGGNMGEVTGDTKVIVDGDNQ
ncbi:MAG: chitobiase/beta-hexosaminidase C-terminal domain-containing protein [Bacteroidales bacterium]|nr:chitobiase/beta-hexosaminidase C-terminal domain-containing protein [Bacteroidales bacterium]